MNKNLYEVKISKLIRNKKFTIQDNVIRINKNSSIICKKKTNRNCSSKKCVIEYDCLLTEKEINYFKDNKDFFITGKPKNSYSIKNNKFTGDIISVYCDAASYNQGIKNPKEGEVFSVASFLVKYNNREMFYKSKVIESCIDNNHAEIIACSLALQYILNNFIDRENMKIIVYTDSLTLVNYGTEKENLLKTIKKSNSNSDFNNSQFYCEQMQNILHELNALLNKLDVYFCWIKGHQIDKNDKDSVNKLNEHVKYQIKSDELCKEKLNEVLIRKGIKNAEFNISK